MKPYEAKMMPLDYKLDKDLLKLLSEANRKYGEYKVLVEELEFDADYFLESILLTESFKSTQIEGTQVTQDDVYYLKYMKTETDDQKEIENLKSVIHFATNKVEEGQELNVDFVNELHRQILNSVRGGEKEPGKIRTTQNWIGPRNCTIEQATFVPPAPEKVYLLLENLYSYMNDSFEDPFLINVALSHMQFETIHAYKDGNGRLGRALIPIQMGMLDESKPVLFMSEILEVYKPSYQRFLMECRNGNVLGYLKFFMQCIIDQCNGYIYKLQNMKKIYSEDMQIIKENIKGASVYLVMEEIIQRVVFTVQEITDATNISRNTVGNIVKQLVKLNIVQPDTTVMKKGYRYGRIYNNFV